MSTFSKMFCSSALALVLGAPAAWADVTNAQVWQAWRNYFEQVGYDVEGVETQAGDTLRVSGAEFSLDLPDQGDGNTGTVTMSIPEITFTELGDGTVQIALPEQMSMSTHMALPEGSPVGLDFQISQDAMDILASGDASDLNYVYSANSVSLTLAQLALSEETSAEPQPSIAFSMAVQDVNGTTNTKIGDLRNLVQEITTGPVAYEYEVTAPQDEATIKGTGGAASISSSGTITIPTTGVSASNLSLMLASGFGYAGDLSYTNGNMDVSFDGPNGTGTAMTSSQGGKIDVAMGRDGITYDVSQNGLEVSALMPGLPLPIQFSMADSGFNLTMPVQKSDEDQDFAFGFKLGEFTMSDLLWGLFDPSAQMPRDPATVALDLTGKAKVLFDFFDPTQAAALEASGAVPGELSSLSLRNLLVDAVGAKLSGTGDFTFDNTDVATFGGLPKPTGAVDLELVGGHGLIDKLVDMGFLPQEQALGARMMMGLFAVPAAQEDTLNSKIEINAQGHVLANGQRIQ